jgi:ubiquinone/menaquinone biosynthesis C-methylase UbiE
MFPSAKDYVSDDTHDPLRLYYYPVIGALYRRRLEMCLELLPEGGVVLEVGFGSGVSLPNLHTKYKELHGVDLKSNCDAVMSCFAERGIYAHLINGSVTELPYENEKFDAVLLVSILEHLLPQELPVAFQEIRRVLRPGGAMVYGVPIERPLMVTAFKLLGYDIHQHHFSTEKQIEETARMYFSVGGKNVLRALRMWFLAIYEAHLYFKK